MVLYPLILSAVWATAFWLRTARRFRRGAKEVVELEAQARSILDWHRTQGHGPPDGHRTERWAMLQLGGQPDGGPV